MIETLIISLPSLGNPLLSAVDHVSCMLGMGCSAVTRGSALAGNIAALIVLIIVIFAVLGNTFFYNVNQVAAAVLPRALCDAWS